MPESLSIKLQAFIFKVLVNTHIEPEFLFSMLLNSKGIPSCKSLKNFCESRWICTMKNICFTSTDTIYAPFSMMQKTCFFWLHIEMQNFNVFTELFQITNHFKTAIWCWSNEDIRKSPSFYSHFYFFNHPFVRKVLNHLN